MAVIKGCIFFAFARCRAIRKIIGMVIQEMAAKLMAENAGARLASAGIHCARPVVVLEISELNSVPKEPTMINGT